MIPAQPCTRMTAGNGPAPDGNRSSPEITTGSPMVKREPSDVRTRLPAVANHTVPDSAAVRFGFKSFNAGAHPVHITTRAQPASHVFISYPLRPPSHSVRPLSPWHSDVRRTGARSVLPG